MNNFACTGIKENCVFNSIQSFHATENYFVDIMHDFLEGVFPHELGLLLHHFVFINKYLTIDILNDRLNYFNFNFQHKNKPHLISYSRLKKFHIKMSASEMLNFVIYLSIIIGELIPENNMHWQLYLILREISGIIFSKHIQKESCYKLKYLIEQHHLLLLKLFPEHTFSPKQHHMMHYPMVILQTGPPILLWCMRHESKHRDAKNAANSVTSRVNICHTLALKHQLKICTTFILNHGFDTNVDMGPTYSSNAPDKEFVPDVKSNMFRLLKECTDKLVLHTNWVETFGTRYKVGSIIVQSLDNDYPVFGKILQITINSKQIVDFICNEVNAVYFMSIYMHMKFAAVTQTHLFVYKNYCIPIYTYAQY